MPNPWNILTCNEHEKKQSAANLVRNRPCLGFAEGDTIIKSF